MISSKVGFSKGQDDEDDEYDYDDEVKPKTKSSAGSRLVGARSALTRTEAPFILGINTHG